MPYTKIYIHAVWSTKDRLPLLSKEVRRKVIEHITDNARLKNIHIDRLNGSYEHLHCLVNMNAEQNIATIMNLLKGESSFWINRQKLTSGKFGWQDEYFAVSVGESQVATIRNYIENQEKHHQKKTFQQEYDEFISHYRFE